MTLIVCLLMIFLNNGTFLNLLKQRNVAVVDGLLLEHVRNAYVVVPEKMRQHVQLKKVVDGHTCRRTDTFFACRHA